VNVWIVVLVSVDKLESESVMIGAAAAVPVTAASAMRSVSTVIVVVRLELLGVAVGQVGVSWTELRLLAVRTTTRCHAFMSPLSHTVSGRYPQVSFLISS
jgi:hypothetical protein